MNPNTWFPGKPQRAQNFTRFSASELNDLHQFDTDAGSGEVALPVDGDATAIKRDRTSWQL